MQRFSYKRHDQSNKEHVTHSGMPRDRFENAVFVGCGRLCGR